MKSFKSGSDMIRFNFRKTEVVLQIDEREATRNRESRSQAVAAQKRGKLNEVGQ